MKILIFFLLLIFTSCLDGTFESSFSKQKSETIDGRDFGLDDGGSSAGGASGTDDSGSSSGSSSSGSAANSSGTSSNGSGGGDDFDRFQAIIEKACINCHKEGGQAASASFEFDSIDEYIDANYVIENDSVNSLLVIRLIQYSDDPEAVKDHLENFSQNMPIESLTAAASAFEKEDYQFIKDFIDNL